MISNMIKGTEPLPSRPASRQRLKPWLMQKIDEGSCPGLKWIDRSQYIFMIPWKHFGKPGVDGETDAKVFRDWAIHTGKYKRGDPPDPSTWKTRFRCALYKLPEIEEQSKMNSLEGDSPYRVYKFLTREEVNERERNRRSADALLLTDSPDMLPMLSPASSTATDGNFSADEIDWTMSITDDDLPFGPGLDEEIIDGLSMDGMADAGSFINKLISEPFKPIPVPLQSGASIKAEPSEIKGNDRNVVTQSSKTTYGYYLLRSQVFYKGKQVDDRQSSNPNGLRFAYQPPPPLPEDIANDESVSVVTHIFGPFQAEQFYFPTPEDEDVLSILKLARRGIVIQTQDGDIYATRLCRAKVFYSSSFYGNPSPVELSRENTTKVFSVMEFEKQLQLHREGNSPPPTCELYFSIAQKWDVNHALKDNYVYISVTHIWAKQRLEQFTQNVSDVLVSEPNMFDQLRLQIDNLYVSNPNS